SAAIPGPVLKKLPDWPDGLSCSARFGRRTAGLFAASRATASCIDARIVLTLGAGFVSAPIAGTGMSAAVTASSTARATAPRHCVGLAVTRCSSRHVLRYEGRRPETEAPRNAYANPARSIQRSAYFGPNLLRIRFTRRTGHRSTGADTSSRLNSW